MEGKREIKGGGGGVRGMESWREVNGRQPGQEGGGENLQRLRTRLSGTSYCYKCSSPIRILNLLVISLE